MLRGIDVYSGQGDVDWPGVRVEGFAFGIAKQTEGNGGVDPKARRNWVELGRSGMVRGGYGYAHPDPHVRDAEEEAELFVRTIEAAGGWGPEDLLMLDLETARMFAPGEPLMLWSVTWRDRVRVLTGHTSLVYTGGPFLDEHDSVPARASPSPELAARLAESPLVLAAYVSDPDRYVPEVWRSRGLSWTIHQRRGDQAPPGEQPLRLRSVRGGACNVDLNHFRGTEADLRVLARRLSGHAPTEPAPPPSAPPETLRSRERVPYTPEGPAVPLGRADEAERSAEE